MFFYHYRDAYVSVCVSSHLQWVCEQHDLSDGGGGQDGVKGRDLGS